MFSGQSNSNVSSLFVPKIKSFQAFISVFVTSNCDDGSINNEHVSIEPEFSHFKSMGYFLLYILTLKGS